MAVDRGLRNPLGIMSIFAEGVRANVKMSTVWPLIGRGTNVPSKFFIATNWRKVEPLTNAKFFKWMYDAIGPGSRGETRIIQNVGNPTYASERDFRSSIYTVAFRVGDDKMVVYAFGTENKQQQVLLEFSNFKIKKRRADTLFTERGQESDDSVVATEGRLWPKIWGGDRKATFTINKHSNYQIVQIVFTGEFV